jgi:hypothetical protein
VTTPFICLTISSDSISTSDYTGTTWYFDQNESQYHVRDVARDSYLGVRSGAVGIGTTQEPPFTIYSVTL